MKLYSHGQVVFFSILSVLIVVMFAVGIGLVRSPLGAKTETEVSVEGADKAPGTVGKTWPGAWQRPA